MPHSLRLYKREKLCSRTDINSLFARGHSVIAYPVRCVYVVKSEAEGDAQFLITIPKKKIRKAVSRVLLRRRIREAYRLNRDLLPQVEGRVQMAFVWLSDEPATYSVIEAKVKEILTRIATASQKMPK
ncbi:MAG: ribonuclease P protein component [Muribaculaceae bacterium]|nr:ribonuclease P protein component [Muribaculaceae bacterium]